MANRILPLYLGLKMVSGFVVVMVFSWTLDSQNFSSSLYNRQIIPQTTG